MSEPDEPCSKALWCEHSALAHAYRSSDSFSTNGSSELLDSGAGRKERHGLKRLQFPALAWAMAGSLVSCLIGTNASIEAAPTAEISQPQATDDPCDSLFALVSRPTVTTSTCAVKPKIGLVEFGYSNAVTKGSGNTSSIPTLALRTGLVRNLEADFTVPSFNRSSTQPVAANFGDSAAGLKYQFATSQRFINAFHVFLTAATGSKAFTGGSGGTSVSYDVSYSISSKFGLAGSFGYNSLALENTAGISRRYSAFTPSLVLSNSFQKAIQSYVEVYGATVSGPNQSGRYCLEAGLQADVSRNVQLDASLGTLCINIVGPSAHYLNFGGAVRF